MRFPFCEWQLLATLARQLSVTVYIRFFQINHHVKRRKQDIMPRKLLSTLFSWRNGPVTFLEWKWNSKLKDFHNEFRARGDFNTWCLPWKFDAVKLYLVINILLFLLCLSTYAKEYVIHLKIHNKLAAFKRNVLIEFWTFNDSQTNKHG